VLSEHDIKIAPSTYYAHTARQRVSQADWDDAHMANRLVDLWRTNRSIYGVDKLHAAARRAGIDIGRDQVARLMRIAGIAGVTRGKHKTVTTKGDPAAARHPDLCKRQWDTPVRPDQWWVADFTYVWTLVGFVYVSFVTDVFSRRILGWRVTSTKTTPAGALRARAGPVHPPAHQRGLHRHRDGFPLRRRIADQYTSLAFTEALIDAGITGSIGSVGDALDNALMESTIGLYKTEVIGQNPHSWTGLREVERATAEGVQWYNTARLHSSIGYLPPIEHEALYRVTTTFPNGEEVA